MKDRFSKKNTIPYILILLSISIFIHFIFLSNPSAIVFDEAHNTKFVDHYLNRDFFMDVHPPLGRLILAATGYLTNFKRDYSKESEFLSYPDNSYLWLRFAVALAGAALPLIVFFIIKELGYKNHIAFLGGMLLNFENSLVINSRIILIGPFVLFFGFLAILFFLKFYKKRLLSGKWHLYLLFTGMFTALTVSVKWNGILFFGIIAVFLAYRYLEAKKRKKEILAYSFIYLIGIPLLIYYSVFMVEFAVLRNSGSSERFMSSQFIKSLRHQKIYIDQSIKERGNFGKFVEENYKMLALNLSLKNVNNFTSAWYEWPFMRGGIAYLGENVGEEKSLVLYLVGNPLIYWFGFLAVLYLGYKNTTFFLVKKLPPFAYGFTFIGFALTWIPYAFAQRDMFLYHYFGALVFSVIALSLLVSDFSKKFSHVISGAVLATALIVFVMISPLTYGFPLSKNIMDMLMKIFGFFVY